MEESITRPEWVPENAGSEFTTSIMPKGYEVSTQTSPVFQITKPKQLSAEEYVAGVLAGDIVMLSKAITLIERKAQALPDKLAFQAGLDVNAQAQQVLQQILPYTGKSIRIGISGPPGAGKSTTIEALGSYLCKQGLKVAVLAIDPSSTLTKGSILGDKTRMEMLCREKNAYIRPSPSAGTLGGVARKTRETILLCEAAGFDVILIETIGVGQSEITVRSMVDCFLLILIPGSGDELQGIKKGVVEISDMIAINKADGDNIQFANLTKSSYTHAVGMLNPATEGWKTTVRTFSALENKGIADIWTDINYFIDITKQSGFFDKRRNGQTLYWVKSMVEEAITEHFYSDSNISSMLSNVNEDVLKGNITPTNAVSLLLQTYFKKG